MATLRTGDVFRLGDALAPEEKLVLLALLDYGSRIYPSQGTLALKTGYSVRTVRNVVKALREKGLITTSQRGAKALTYLITAPAEFPSSNRTVTNSVVTPSNEGRLRNPIKALNEARGAASDRHAVPHREAPRAAQCGTPCSGIITTPVTTPPNQALAIASSGWGIDSEELWQRIVARDPRAPMDLSAQVRVTAKVLGQYGLSQDEASTAWSILVRVWAHTGNRPYDTVSKVLEKSLDGAKDVASVVLYRLKAVAA
jgi:biotin operon repressor